jgi:glycerophosphoryl diester phosphodiesterase
VDGSVQLVAHRGFAREAPENTLAAVSHAADAGANAVEVDVRAAADGTPVVAHDATVDRVTGASGPVSAFDPGALASMTVLGSGEGVPTLAAVLARANDRGLAVNVEVKEPGIAAAVVDAVHESALPATAVWASSFDPDALRRIADANETTDGPAVDTAVLAASVRDQPVATAVDCDCVAVHPQYRATIAGDLVERAHAAGLDVFAWTLDSPWVAAVVANAGVDGLIADVALEDCAGPR